MGLGFGEQGSHRQKPQIHKTFKHSTLQTSERILDHHHEINLPPFYEVLKRKNMGSDEVRILRAIKPQDPQNHKILTKNIGRI